MSPPFTDDDAGKRVETAAGDPLGVVEMVEPETLYVEADEAAIDALRAVLAWEAETERVVPVDEEIVGEVTAEAIRLEPDAGDDGTDPVIERDERTAGEDERGERRELASDAGEMDDDELPTGEGRSGDGIQPETETMHEAGEERHAGEAEKEGERPPEGDRTMTDEHGGAEDR